jgi:uncharacterized YigZ family protein
MKTLAWVLFFMNLYYMHLKGIQTDFNMKYFYSIDKCRVHTLKLKRSVFICSMEHVDSIDCAKQFISRIAKENKTATHNCWAYILGDQGQIFHSSDAGEPSGTAGRPMLNTMQAHGMTNTAAVVTRHFGGIKLGIRGLMEAYSRVVEQTIELGKLKKLVPSCLIRVEVSYDFNDILLNNLKNDMLGIRQSAYTDKVIHVIEVELEKYDKVMNILKACQSQGSVLFSVPEQHDRT